MRRLLEEGPAWLGHLVVGAVVIATQWALLSVLALAAWWIGTYGGLPLLLGMILVGVVTAQGLHIWNSYRD